jgi:nucleoside-diphosphate-sugar epimerase
MKILITGGEGFIGSALTLCVLKCGEINIGMDNHNDYCGLKLEEERLARLPGHPSKTYLPIDLAAQNL